MANNSPEKNNTSEVISAIAKKYDSVVEKNVLTWISSRFLLTFYIKYLHNPDKLVINTCMHTCIHTYTRARAHTHTYTHTQNSQVVCLESVLIISWNV